MYCNSNFIRKLREQQKLISNNVNESSIMSEYMEKIQMVLDHDTTLLPIFADKDSDEKHPTVLVMLTPSKWRADLF